ncbi:hypothetical protein [Noviherbaspirillum sp.]|uniref:hypothetical protein n=1 Tax=Noviherbaspirillum sp. TaxID=1926288 RepID=UPI002FE3919F
MTTDLSDAKRTYDPNRLLDTLKVRMQLESDIALAELLEIPPPVISQIRHRGYPMAPSILIRMHEVSSLSIREMREIIGDRRRRVRTSYDMSYINSSTGEEMVASTQVNVARRFLYLTIAVLIGFVFWMSRI